MSCFSPVIDSSPVTRSAYKLVSETTMLSVREADDTNDLEAVVSVVRAAFGREGDSVTRLVQDALKDPSARPLLSLLAFRDEEPAGHILFTKARLEDADPGVAVALLAPLAVVPKFQKQGIGGQLIENGVELLAHSGVELVFVTGHPRYYPRHGFQPASPVGFVPPYPMPEEHPDAWMVREVQPGAIAKHSPARFICAKTIDRPEYWKE